MSLSPEAMIWLPIMLMLAGFSIYALAETLHLRCLIFGCEPTLNDINDRVCPYCGTDWTD